MGFALLSRSGIVAGLNGFVCVTRCRRFAEEARDFFGAFGDERDVIAHPDASEEIFDVMIAQANAAVRGILPDGAGTVGAVNAEALNVEADPACAKGICFAGADDDARMVVGGIFKPPGDLEFAGWAGGVWSADGDIVDFDYMIPFEKGEFAVGKTDDDAT